MADTSSASVPQQLMAEAVRLAGDLPDALKKVLSLNREVDQEIAKYAEMSTYARTKALCNEAVRKREQFSAEVMSLADGASRVLDRAREDNHLYTATIQRMLAHNRQADPEKLANEELLAQCIRARQAMYDTLDSLALCVASVEIPLFSLVYFHAEILAAYLGRPSPLRAALDTSVVLVKAVATDIAGTAIPWLGTLTTVLELMKPRIEREAKQMRSAVQTMDRLFQLDDRSTDLLQNASFVQATTHLADEALKTTRESFERDADWLIGVLKAAERT